MDNVTPYLKAYAALIGSICTALLAVYTADTAVGQVLTVASVICTAVVTWRVPNLDPKGERQDESVQPPHNVDVPPTSGPIMRVTRSGGDWDLARKVAESIAADRGYLNTLRRQGIR